MELLALKIVKSPDVPAVIPDHSSSCLCGDDILNQILVGKFY